MSHTINDIKIGQKFHNGDLEDPFICEVIRLNVDGQLGWTELKIIETRNPTHKYFGVGVVFKEEYFISHWNKGAYKLLEDIPVTLTNYNRLSFL